MMYYIFLLCLIFHSCSASDPIIAIPLRINYDQSFVPHTSAVNQKYKHNEHIPASYTTVPYLYTYSAIELASYFAQCGYTQEQILKHHALYANPEFIKLIKTYAGYKSYITHLYKKLQKKSGFAKWLGTLTDAHKKGLTTCVQRLYQELEQQNKTEIQQKQNHIQKYNTVTEQDVDAWQTLSEIYQHYICGNPVRIHNRIAAYKDMQVHGEICMDKQYVLAPNTAELLQMSAYNPDEYTYFAGNQIQHILHQECIELITHVSIISAQSPLYAHRETLIDCIDIACKYNRNGLVHKASAVADFCWTLLDYGTAIVEGAAYGAVSAIKDIVQHPLQTTACIVAGQYVLAYQLSKVLYDVAGIGITALTDASRAKEQWQHYIEPITTIINALKNKEISCRDAIKAGTALSVGLIIQGKLLHNLGKFYTHIKSNALIFAKNNTTVSPQQYMKTTDGLLLRASTQATIDFLNEYNSSECPPSCSQMYEKLKLALKIEEFTSIIKVTTHGIERLIERGFTPKETLDLIANPHYCRTQFDGAKVFIQNINDRYKIIVLNETTGEVITALKNTTRKRILHLGKNYGWEL